MCLHTKNRCFVLATDSNLANYFNKGVNVPIIRRSGNPKVGWVGTWIGWGGIKCGNRGGSIGGAIVAIRTAL